MSSKIYPVREFLKFTPKELFDGLKTNVIVRFDDGDVPLTAREIIINRFIWDVFTYFKEMPIYSKYDITKYYTNGIFTAGSLTTILEVLFKDIVDIYVRPTHSRAVLNDYFFEKCQDIYNDIYNVVICQCWDYCTSIDVIDFLQIQFQNELIGSIKDLNKTKDESGVEKVYKTLDRVIMTYESLKNNNVVKGYISGTYNKNQVMQMCGCRGFVSELNSSIFKEPVVSSYVLGLRTNYEIAVVSREAAKSLYVSHKAIEQSEYLARTIQLVTMRMNRLIDGDCGSTDYYEWYIDPDPIIGKSELDLIIGKYYLDEETNSLKPITKNDTHLIGKTIKLRSPHKCKVKHPACCCVACVGEIGYSIPYHSNIGHTASVEATEKISQSILGTKHLTGSAKSIEFNLGPTEAEYFNKVNDDGIRIKNPAYNIKKYKYDLIVPQDSARGFNGITVNDNVDKLIPSKISRLDEIYLRITDKFGNEKYESIQVAFNKNLSREVKKTGKSNKVMGYFTTGFLKYIINGDGTNPNYQLEPGTDNYIISLNEWIRMCQNRDLEGKEEMKVIEFPKLEFSFLQLTKEVADVVKKISSEDGSIDKFIQTMFNILNVKLDINLALIEIIACSFIIMSKEKGDVHLGRGKSNDVASVAEIIYRSSLGGTAGFERHKSYFLSPTTFGNNIVAHPMDVLLRPRETVQEVLEGKRS